MQKVILAGIFTLFFIGGLKSQSIVIVNNQVWHKMSAEDANKFLHPTPKYDWIKNKPKPYLFFKEAGLQKPFINVLFKPYMKVWPKELRKP